MEESYRKDLASHPGPESWLCNPLVPFALFVAVFAASTGFSSGVTVEHFGKGAVVKIDDQPFTEYLIRSGNKPILWPIIGPTGKPMTRAYPMQNMGNEVSDHPLDAKGGGQIGNLQKSGCYPKRGGVQSRLSLADAPGD